MSLLNFLKCSLVVAVPFSLVWFWAWVFTHEMHSAYSLAASISSVYSVALAAILAVLYCVNKVVE